MMKPSLPMRGAWIEILSLIGSCGNIGSRSPCGERGLKLQLVQLVQLLRKSLPMRGAWIEIVMRICRIRLTWSLPMRGAWIEMQTESRKSSFRPVAPHAGSVD